jgi:hypothetical protein
MAEKYWVVWAGPLANNLFNFNFIFLSNSLKAVAERAACLPRLAGVIPQRWTDVGPPVEKSSEFKSGKYGGQSTENQIPPQLLADLGSVGRR